MKQALSNFLASSSPLVIKSVIFLVGIALGLLLNDIPFLSFKKEISLGEIANLILALYIAIYVPFYLTKKIQNKRTEKDLLIEGCSNLVITINKMREEILELYIANKSLVKVDQTRILLGIRNISNLLNQLCNQCKEYETDDNVANMISELKKTQIDFWNDLALNFGGRSTKITSDIFSNTERNMNTYTSNVNGLKICINNA